MLEDTIPAVKWPKVDGVYKVMQFEKENQPYLRFSRNQDEFHADIFLRFCIETEQTWVEKPIKDGKIYLFEDKSPYALVGAGACAFSPRIKIADFLKNRTSEGYGMELNMGHLDKLKKLCPDWNIKII